MNSDAIRRQRYLEIKLLNYPLYRACVASADAITINHNLSNRVGADIEYALISIALDALESEGKP